MKTIVRGAHNGAQTFFLVVAILSTLVGMVPLPAFALSVELLRPEMRDYQQSVPQAFQVPAASTGEISGTALGTTAYPEIVRDMATFFGLSIPDVLVSSGNNFNFSLPGISETLTLMTSSPAINYSYNLPYNLSFTAPTTVTAGQRVYLNPSVTWGAPTLQGSQSLRFSTSQTLRVDIPNDGVAPVDIRLYQGPESLHIYGSIPFGPFSMDIPGQPIVLDSNSPTIFETPLGTPVDLSQFGTGSAEFFGVFNTFGGTGSLNTSGGTTELVGESSVKVSTSPAVFTDAWASGGDQLVFMGAIPVVGPFIALASTVFDLYHELDVDIQRQDIANFEITSLPYFDVPDTLAGGTYSPTVHMDYQGKIISNFDYLINTKIIFDGPGFEPQIWNIPLGSINAGQARAEFTGTSTFDLSLPVSVISGTVSNLGHQYAQLIRPSYDPFSHGTPPGYAPVTPADTTVSVPEPSTLLLAGIGLAGLAWMRKKISGVRS